jgi:cytochrome c oxidase subunit 1
MYLTVVLTSVFLGKRQDPTSLLLIGQAPIAAEPVMLAPTGNGAAVLAATGNGHAGGRGDGPAGAAHIEAEAEDERYEPKGTFVIVLIFLGFFATYYLANWWLLGRVWGIS